MQNGSQRIDVIIQLNKMIEMMSRSQGASIKEICKELECNERTFYRRKDDLEKMDVPLFCRGDPDAVTNTKRWYIDKNYNQESVTVFLTPAEKILLRKLIYKKTYSSEMEKQLCEKINKAMLYDTNSNSFQVADNNFDTSELIDDDKILTILSNAIEKQHLLTMSSYYTHNQLLGLDEEINFYHLFFAPYTFVQQDDLLWVIGKLYNTRKIEEVENSCKGDIIALYVNAIGETKKLPENKFKIPENFNSEEWVKKLFTKHDEIPITFNAEQSLVDTLLRKKWFNFIDVNYIFDRQVFTINTTDITKAKEFLLSFGSKVKVLEPQYLVDEIENELKLTCTQYSKEDNMPPCSYKNELIFPEDAEIISYGKHKTNNALYRYYNTWWRQILSLHREPLYSQLFHLNDTYLSSPVGPMYTEKDDPDLPRRLIFKSMIAYEKHMFLEYPMDKEIIGDFEWLKESRNAISSPWWDDNEKCTLRYILNRNEKIIKFAENYKKTGPIMLITGINYIDPQIAEEIMTTGKLYDIPCAALVLKNIRNNDGTTTIKSYFYYKEILE